jgi:amino acid transporter
MLYAFSRDGAVPGSKFWHKINKRTRTPTNSIWLCALGAFLIAVPYYWNYTAYAAVTSIAVIGLYIAYVLPVFLRLRAGERFQRGPWHLGKWSKPIGMIACTWVACITILFMLPTVGPWSAINRDNFNYTVVAVGAVFLFATIYWFASARRWFKGPGFKAPRKSWRQLSAS